MASPVVNDNQAEGTDLPDLRRKIYVAIMSAMNAEECFQSLTNIGLDEGKEMELVNMVVDCCASERNFSEFYGQTSQTFCKLSCTGQESFEKAFGTYYNTIHCYQGNKLGNIASLFAFLFARDAIKWNILQLICLTEEGTTPSSRIFVKILFQEIQTKLGLEKLADRLMEKTLYDELHGMFPRTNARHVRFSINFLTTIGLGKVTEEMRSLLQTSMESENHVHPDSPTEAM